MPQRPNILASWMLCAGFTVYGCTDSGVKVVYNN